MNTLIKSESVIGTKSEFLKNTLSVCLGVGLLTLFSKITIPLFFTPVPLTLAPMAPLLLGARMGKYKALVSCAFYLLLSIAGLPLLAGSISGSSVLTMPSLGYIVGYGVAAFLIGHLIEKFQPKSLVSMFLIHFLGMTALWACGLIGLSFHVPISLLFIQGLLPFIPMDIVKTTMATAIAMQKNKTRG